MDPVLRKHIVTSFKLSGLTLRTDACNFLTETLLELDPTDRDNWIEKIIDFVLKQPLVLPVVEKKFVETAILGGEEDILIVISAFEVPRFRFNSDRKKFVLTGEEDTPELFDDASCKGTMMLYRYSLIHQFTLRNNLFNDLAMDGNNYKLKPIESLLTTTTRVRNIVILGLLTHLKEGQYYLEDPTGIVALDLSNASFQDGLFTEGSFVLAEGSYKDETFQVHAIGLPPREAPESSRTYFSPYNYFGGSSRSSLRNNHRLKTVEIWKKDVMFVFISDLWLDQLQILEKLELLFAGYSNDPPFAFILMGNFQSTHKGHLHYECVKEGFRSLAERVGQFQGICDSSHFIIIPGPSDSPSANILPRPELPDFFLSDFTSVVKHVFLATNPCRIQYCTQEIVVVREDLVTKLYRNTIHYPTNKDIGWHFAQTIICQGTLAPLSLNVCPLYWNFAQSLDIYPTPDVIVVGDQQKPFSTLYNKCHVVNPGSFSKGGFTFKAYYPSNKTFNDCQITSNDDS